MSEVLQSDTDAPTGAPAERVYRIDWLNLTGIGQTNALYVGTNSWVMGLTFEF